MVDACFESSNRYLYRKTRMILGFLLLSLISSALLVDPALWKIDENPAIPGWKNESIKLPDLDFSPEPKSYDYLITQDIVGLDLDDEIMSAKVLRMDEQRMEQELSKKYGIDLSPNPDVQQEPTLGGIVVHPIPNKLEDVEDYGLGKIRMRSYCRRNQALRDDCILRRKTVSVKVRFHN